MKQNVTNILAHLEIITITKKSL